MVYDNIRLCCFLQDCYIDLICAGADYDAKKIITDIYVTDFYDKYHILGVYPWDDVEEAEKIIKSYGYVEIERGNSGYMDEIYITFSKSDVNIVLYVDGGRVSTIGVFVKHERFFDSYFDNDWEDYMIFDEDY